MNSKFRYGALFQTQPLLDCLDHMSAEADQRRRSLSKYGAADLVASFLIDWPVMASYVQLVVHCANSTS